MLSTNSNGYTVRSGPLGVGVTRLLFNSIIQNAKHRHGWVLYCKKPSYVTLFCESLPCLESIQLSPRPPISEFIECRRQYGPGLNRAISDASADFQRMSRFVNRMTVYLVGALVGDESRCISGRFFLWFDRLPEHLATNIWSDLIAVHMLISGANQCDQYDEWRMIQPLFEWLGIRSQVSFTPDATSPQLTGSDGIVIESRRSFLSGHLPHHFEIRTSDTRDILQHIQEEYHRGSRLGFYSTLKASISSIPDYEQARSHLSRIGHGWELEFYGKLRDGLDPFGPLPIAEHEVWIPLASWPERIDKEDYYGALAIRRTGDSCVLELSSTAPPDEKRALRKIKWKELGFTLVWPPEADGA